MPLLNYTTKIDPDKTANEIARCLSSHGAMAVLTEFNEQEGFIESLSFKIRVGDQIMGFRLPCDWHPVLEIFEGDKRIPRHARTQEQAVRTAWRIVKDWVEAQMALVETKMVTTAEVFLPYAVMKDGRTLSEHIQSDPKFLLSGGGE